MPHVKDPQHPCPLDDLTDERLRVLLLAVMLIGNADSFAAKPVRENVVNVHVALHNYESITPEMIAEARGLIELHSPAGAIHVLLQAVSQVHRMEGALQTIEAGSSGEPFKDA